MHQKATLLINLGSPKSTELSDVRTYLKEFLMDEYVIDIPWIRRFFLVNFIITPMRAPETAKAYKSIWCKEKGPLVENSLDLIQELEKRCTQPIALAMRYQEPSIEEAITKLLKTNPNLSRLHVIALYPHYAQATTKSSFEKTKQIAKKLAPHLTLSFQDPFYNHPNYIESLRDIAEPYLRKVTDHLVVSYHGLPHRQLKKADPTSAHCLNLNECCDLPSPAWRTCYKHQVYQTTKLLVQALKFPKEKVSVTFQSRLGNEPWTEPTTEKTLIQLAKNGQKRVTVICPSFVTDCLETLEEINMQARETFFQAGGSEFTYIPCLNTHEKWIDTLKEFIEH